MKALVTGSSGFIGSCLCEHLRTQGCAVVTAGRPGSGRSDHPIADVTDEHRLAEVLRQESPDIIFHAAGIARANTVADFYAVNTFYAVSLLAAVRAVAPGARVLLFGSAAEYGDAGPDPARETLCPRPFTPYGISKLAQTMHGLAAARDGLRVTVVRLFNVIGPGVPPHLALGSWLAQLRLGRGSGRPARIQTGSLEAWRDFVDVRDAVDVLWRLARSTESVGQVVNVCSGEAVQLKALLARMIAVHGGPVEVASAATVAAAEVPVSVGSTELLQRYAGVRPSGVTDELLRCCLERLER